MNCLTDPFSLQAAGAGSDSALTEAIGEVEKQFGTMVIKARTSIRDRAAAIHPELHPMGFKVLTILSQSGPMQQVGLAEAVRIDKAMMSRTIKQLEEFGLVSRCTDPSDGRALLVDMTAEARKRYDATLAHARKLLHDRFSTWDLAEVQRLADLLARLNESSG
ncbi:MarR family winged helix-turn-helix transcriptional regulator [Paeniglutamicibacter cryotolerans]|uniref:DNA-binding MarR family transcriptional regulator n=1 Tax=Paeniglutamicibacter cryotolerans TaxID=670079 RepID=A0A839QJD8_9MICC|nr:MarR family transcriptional regulator [Paeniglutamicibacter cryotolerans]MBB2994655.1 DNA-binding MarR family transcriptional regulator [Paeniglutamicibacter cryotolerans]